MQAGEALIIISRLSKTPRAQFRDIYGGDPEKNQVKKKTEGIALQDLAGAQINLGIKVTQCVKDRGLDVKDQAERWSY